MKTKIYKQIFAIIFMVMLLGFSVVNIKNEHGNIEHDIKKIGKPTNATKVGQITKQLDTILTDNIAGRYKWYELYGSVFDALGKKEENNFTYVKDKNGFLYSGNFWNTSNIDSRELTLRVRRLSDKVSDAGTKVVCIMYPTKYNEAWSDGYYGIPYNNLNEYADSVLLHMRRFNVDYIDFRQVFIEEKMTAEDIFYKTDHHWNIPTAFFSTGVILEHLKDEYNDDWDMMDYYKDINNYNVETYEDIYLGSQGREAGVEYAGMDDYTYIYPKFETKYTYTGGYREGGTFTKQGDTLKTLISKKYIDYENVYEREMNNSYMQGICLYDSIVNELNPNGHKVLFIRDSYSSPVATFMAPMCSEIDLLWSIHVTEEDVEEAISKKDYDYIFVAMAIDNFVDEGFPFCKVKEEKEESEE